MRKNHLLAPLTLACASLLLATEAGAVTSILINFDDGVPDTIHSSSIRNGGFEESAVGDGQSLPSIPSWGSYFSPEGDTTNVLTTAGPATGANRAFVNGFGGSGDRIHISQTIPAAAWTIAAGDVFTFSVKARSGAGFTVGTHGINLVIHVVDGDGNAVNDPVNFQAAEDRIVSTVFSEVTATYETFSVTTNPIAADSPWIGNLIEPRLLVAGPRSAFAPVDDVFLSATAIPEPGTVTLLGLTLLGFVFRRRRV